jgi:putative transposase
MFTLERAGRPLTITTKGVQWKRRHYIAEWMVGRVGSQVTLRYMPHHESQVEIYQGTTFLGTAYLTDQATPAQLRALDNAKKREAAALRADLKKAERLRKARYAPATQPSAPTRITPLTSEQAASQLQDLDQASQPATLRAQSLPDLLPRPTPSATWTLPTPPTKPKPASGATPPATLQEPTP